MSLDVLLLEKLVKWRSANGQATVEASGDGWNAAVAVECVDVVGCRLRELSLRPVAQTSAVELKARAEQLCQRVTGLLEPLRLVEVDGTSNTALLRSEEPGQLGDERFYYEVLLSGDGGSVVRRYQSPHTGQPRRQQVAFTLTHEALAKLVRDLTAA
ncbi:MAG TPA: hypothetical protein VMF69_26885 [Gemmataceae bacterium]|nr:hypothetical protein [Gemmataceae bacterium]